jgi:hypothetical protein
VNERLPPPEFVTPTAAAAGFVPLPWLALNDKTDEDKERDGEGTGAATLKVAVMVAGEP